MITTAALTRKSSSWAWTAPSRPSVPDRAHTSSVEHKFDSPGDDDDHHLLQLLLQTQRQPSFRSTVEPPTIKRTPWRTPVGRGCGFQFASRCSCKSSASAATSQTSAGNLFLRREQQFPLALDQRRCRAPHRRRTERRRAATGNRRCWRRRRSGTAPALAACGRSACLRSAPQTISLAIIGS